MLNNVNVLTLNPQLMANFQETYYPEHAEISRVDAFASFFCFSQFEMFRPYNKSIIAIAVMRLETCRTPRRWSELIGNLTELSGIPKHVIGANNHYDREYIRYFTNIDVHLLPSFSLYTGGVRYNPTQQTYLFSAQRSGLEGELDQLWNSEFSDRYFNLSSNFRLVHAALSVRIWDVRVQRLGFTSRHRSRAVSGVDDEHLRAVPHVHSSLLPITRAVRQVERALPRGVRPHDRHEVGLHERVRHPAPSDAARHARPEREGDPKAHEYWLRLADYYTLPHITHFTSVGQLVEILHHMKRERLLAISAAMSDFNRSKLKQLLRFWRSPPSCNRSL